MMGVLLEEAGGRSRVLDLRRRGFICLPALLFISMLWGGADYSLAVQQHQLLPQTSGEGQGIAGVDQQTVQHSPASARGYEGGSVAASVIPVQHVSSPGQQGSTSTEHAPSIPPVQPPAMPHGSPQGQPAPPTHEPTSAAPAPLHPQGAKPGQEAPPAHGAQVEAHGGETSRAHGPSLPELSPVPGVTFVETMINLLDHELNGRTLGWRPNDVILGRFTDNINNYQFGVLEALRFTTLRLKDSLTRMGDADTYDPDLEQALNLLMNRATLFWFPSAETAYGEAVGHFRNFLQRLGTGQRSFYYRVDNLKLLISSYKDLLGNVNRNLIKSPVSWFETDDYFYYAKGVAHVYYEILRVVRVGYKSQLASTLNALDIMDEILHELDRAEQMDPWIILDSDLDGIFANHRANLNAPLSEVAHLLGVMSSF